MRTFLKYLLIFLFLLILLLYYLFNTSSGNEYFNNYLSSYLSQKSKNKILIENIDFSSYPHIHVAMKINHHSIDLIGEVSYSNGLRVKGFTSEFGGKLYFDYERSKSKIFFKLEKLSLEKTLKKFSYPVRMTANIFGTITYDIKNKIVIFDNQLKQTRLIKNQMSNMIFIATNIDVTKYLYDKSTFKGEYQHDILRGDLKIDSGKEHIYFRELRVHLKTKKITSYFELKMDGQEVSGKVNGTTSDPSFRIDVSKLIKHQVNEFSEKAKSIFNNFF